ncbi:electron transport complex subunit RsxC [Avibacterium paragallinarum]|uniref:Ion-translocating oxidoreductase complex subunit C n=1 Tax=Avibacterium paragallinarum TaxID=728 RepID=A0A380X308_AVIPA|nr:electron transport complex subunit RsxC [Avibacterium paragallinarum]SUU97057.1 Nitrogen fixation protein rnfC [Avibacterium paragallinarum]
MADETDVLNRFNSGRLWDFDGGIHPPEMKSQSNQRPIQPAIEVDCYYIPVKQHAGNAGNLLVQVGDQVLKGQPLTRGEGLRALPVHAPTSGKVIAISPYVAAHPSGLAELTIQIQADGKDQWREQHPIEDFLSQTPAQLIETIYQAGIAGLGGAVFPTAAKIQSAENKVKLLIINGAECEPYITCDDRLMQDYPDEIIEGIRILRYILRPEKVVIAIEDNKPQAIQALKHALKGANDIEVRVIPTKYPSGAAKQLIQVLTGVEVPSGQRSSSIGVLMHNVGTAFAIKRAVINDEPLIERVVTLTGDKIPHKGNHWVRFGTPISALLQQVSYQYDARFPVFMGGPMMGFTLPHLNAPVTKVTNCLLAPDHFEYAEPEPEQACIRCSACSDACPVHLMPQQLYWFARSEDHQKSEQYALQDCIECGICAYVCPSHIPLIQYFRQEKAKIWEIKAQAQKSHEAKLRFEARQARLEKEEQARKARTQRAAEARREEIAKQQGIDPVQAALERFKAKKQSEAEQSPEVKTFVDEKGQLQPDNAEIMAQRKARRLARQQEAQGKALLSTEGNLAPNAVEGNPKNESAVEKTPENPTALDPKKAAIAAAIARAKAKKQAQAGNSATAENSEKQNAELSTVEQNTETAEANTQSESAIEKTPENPTALDPKKAAIAAAIARAKAKKQAQAGNSATAENSEKQNAELSTVEQNTETAEANTQSKSVVEKTPENSTALDPKKAAIAAAIARAKAKKQAQAGNSATEKQNTELSTVEENLSSQAEIKASRSLQQSDRTMLSLDQKNAVENALNAIKAGLDTTEQTISMIQATSSPSGNAQSRVATPEKGERQEKMAENLTALDAKKAAIAAAVARAKAKKQAREQHIKE